MYKAISAEALHKAAVLEKVREQACVLNPELEWKSSINNIPI